jgi:hypothetical protein
MPAIWVIPGRFLCWIWGEPVLIKNIVHDLIELSGLSPTSDIRIEISGMKMGEKLSEVLVDERSETLGPTRLHKIQTIGTRPFDAIEFTAKLRALEASAWQGNADEVYRNLAAVNMGFVSQVPLHPSPHLALHSKAEAALQPASGPKLSQHRLYAVHAPGKTGR